MVRLGLILLIVMWGSTLSFSAQCVKQLVNTWQYSSGESTNGYEVYRPVSYQLPASRGRRELTFRADGTFTENSIGRDDKRAEISGTWALVGKHHLLLIITGQSRTERTILRCGQDRPLDAAKRGQQLLSCQTYAITNMLGEDN